MTCIPFSAATLPEWDHQWFNNGNAFYKCVYVGGGGYKYILRLLLCMLKMLNECFYKGGSHTRYDIIYFVMNIIKCSCLYFFSTLQVNWGWPSFYYHEYIYH